MREVDVGAAVVALFRAQEWEVFQEVLTARGDCCDIVATRNAATIAVECKVAPTLDLFDQALRWQPHCERVYAAAPAGQGGLHWLARHLLRDLGVGFIDVRRRATGLEAEVVLDGRLNAASDGWLRETLREEHKTFAPAGSSGAARFSPYKATCAELRVFVEAHPGCLLRDAVAAIRHHYRTDQNARSGLTHWIDEDRVAGVRIDRTDGNVRLYPATTAARRTA